MNAKLTELLLSELRNHFRLTPNEVEVYVSDNPIPVMNIDILTAHLQRRIEAELCIKEHKYKFGFHAMYLYDDHNMANSRCVNCGREKDA